MVLSINKKVISGFIDDYKQSKTIFTNEVPYRTSQTREISFTDNIIPLKMHWIIKENTHSYYALSNPPKTIIKLANLGKIYKSIYQIDWLIDYRVSLLTHQFPQELLMSYSKPSKKQVLIGLSQGMYVCFTLVSILSKLFLIPY